jgi:hypothetical protein
MAQKKLSQKDTMNRIIKMKETGIARQDVQKLFESQNLTPPSVPTIRKYYTMEVPETADNPYAKQKAFDIPACRDIIIQCLSNNTGVKISAVYDLLVERLVEQGAMKTLPGNEQTLRSYCKYLRENGFVEDEPDAGRIYDQRNDPEAGKEMQLDYGVQRLNGGEEFHFICLLLRRSRMLFVRGQDHRFNAGETCSALYAFFILLGGRPEMLVIDQDACLVYEEKYGEIINTRVFADFLTEQQLTQYVCRKADPETKGSIENTVKFVKTNYLSSRLDLSMKELTEGISLWCSRKNEKRIHRSTCRIPLEYFTCEEKKCLRPLLPSVYDLLHEDAVCVTVGKMHCILYKTNTYQIPREYAFRNVWRKITQTELLIYADKELTKLICSWPLPGNNVKRHNFTRQEFMAKRSEEWLKIKNRLLTGYHSCPEMLHFLNGICQENQRYRSEQLCALEKYLEEKQPSTELLNEVLHECCETYSYKITQFEYIYERHAICNESVHAVPEAWKPGLAVQHRSQNVYSQVFEQRTKEAH